MTKQQNEEWSIVVLCLWVEFIFFLYFNFISILTLFRICSLRFFSLQGSQCLTDSALSVGLGHTRRALIFALASKFDASLQAFCIWSCGHWNFCKKTEGQNSCFEVGHRISRTDFKWQFSDPKKFHSYQKGQIKVC